MRYKKFLIPQNASFTEINYKFHYTSEKISTYIESCYKMRIYTHIYFISKCLRIWLFETHYYYIIIIYHNNVIVVISNQYIKY